MKCGKSQFKTQTNQAASQGLGLLSPLAPKKGHSLSPPPALAAECGNDLTEGSKAGCGAVLL